MRKPTVSLIFTLLLILIFTRKPLAAPKFTAGINLDCARAYYSVKELKAYIDYLSHFQPSFLHLHLTDNENVGLVCETLGQTEKNAVLHKNRHLNPKTGKYFLTKKEIKELLSYAKKKKVDLIPEINFPGHIGGFLRLSAIHYGNAFPSSISEDFDGNSGELKLSDKKALLFSKEIYREYAKLFSDCTYFHIGCDEVFHSSSESLLSFIEQTVSFLRKKGFKVRLWNDGLGKMQLAKLDKNLEITYWSFDGDVEDAKEKKKRRKERASLPALQKAGFKVLNYNSYYLYYVPSKENSVKEDLDYMISDLKKNWVPQKWDGTSSTLSSNKNLLGACISVWNEESEGVSGKLIFKQVRRLFREMVQSLYPKRRVKTQK